MISRIRRQTVRLCLAIVLLLPLAAQAQDFSVTFDGETFHLAYVGGKPHISLNEYIPKGSTLENWEKMVALHVFHNQSTTDPATYAEQFGKLIKKINPQAGYQIIRNAKTGEAVIDFLTWTETPLIVEFNVFKYKKGSVPGEIIAYQYAFRGYGESTEKFQSEFKANRVRWRDLVALADYPEFVSKETFGR